MESVFLRFDSYDFEADRRFQDGLKSLRDETKLLDMKLFFYNRFVEPIDRISYRQWSSAAPRATQLVCEQLDQRTPSDPDDRNSQTVETPAEEEEEEEEKEEEEEEKQLSFAEVMRLVQEGKEVPGATKLDIKPTNQSPTPSQMDRMLKPWETSQVSK